MLIVLANRHLFNHVYNCVNFPHKQTESRPQANSLGQEIISKTECNNNDFFFPVDLVSQLVFIYGSEIKFPF